MTWILAVIILIMAAVLLYQKYRQRRLLLKLSEMLDQALWGNYTESAYDETMLSSLEAKMVRFLNSSTVSDRRVNQERNKIYKLISDISHQTKTPVSNLLLYTELLEEKELPVDCQEAAKALKSQVQKLSFLITSLVKMSRLETGIVTVKPVKNKVEGLLFDVEHEIRLKAEEKEISLKIEYTDESAMFDQKWTGEALYNLVDNAVKYTQQGGNIIIKVKSFEFFCQINVMDNGMGLTEEEHARIFTRFYRSPRVAGTEGTGVGLFLAREIAAAQGGYIKVASQIGEGSVFSLYLPLFGDTLKK